MLQNIFDSHAHYDSSQFDEDREQVLGELQSQGVTAVMTCGSNLKNSKKAVEISNRYKYIYSSVGVHPHDAKGATDSLESELEELCKNQKVKAIGEIGLDYHYDFSPRDTQKEVFIRQIKLANKLNLPVIVHDREAHQDTFDILKEYRPKGIIHSYSGSVEMLEEILKLGLYVGFTGVVTFKNAKKPAEAVAAAPLDRLLVETDCPYLAPVPYRGKRSDSSMIESTIRKMAKIKNIDPQELLNITFRNACDIFRISNFEK